MARASSDNISTAWVVYTVSFGEPCKPLDSSSFPRLVGPRNSLLFEASQPGNALQKFWRNRERIEKKERSGSRTRRKNERRIKIVRKTSALILELMALKTPTQICDSADNQCPSELPAGHLGYTYTTLISGVMEAFKVYLLHDPHDLLSGFYRPKIPR
jgi:hypothetical protein